MRKSRSEFVWIKQLTFVIFVVVKLLQKRTNNLYLHSWKNDVFVKFMINGLQFVGIRIWEHWYVVRSSNSLEGSSTSKQRGRQSCMTNVKRITSKIKRSIYYLDVPSAIWLAPHYISLPLPQRPYSYTLDSDSKFEESTFLLLIILLRNFT